MNKKASPQRHYTRIQKDDIRSDILLALHDTRRKFCDKVRVYWRKQGSPKWFEPLYTDSRHTTTIVCGSVWPDSELFPTPNGISAKMWNYSIQWPFPSLFLFFRSIVMYVFLLSFLPSYYQLAVWSDGARVRPRYSYTTFILFATASTFQWYVHRGGN